jgi:hypothetical protein
MASSGRARRLGVRTAFTAWGFDLTVYDCSPLGSARLFTANREQFDFTAFPITSGPAAGDNTSSASATERSRFR